MKVLGIDVGGTGIKGAPVDTEQGTLLADRHRLLTPRPATPDAVTGTVAELARHFDWKGPIGCGFPAVIRSGRVCTAANISKKWLGQDVCERFGQATGCSVRVANDADVAGLAEMRLGAGQGRSGLVLFLTLGTGIGTALFMDGKLVPNTELGHIELDGREAEKWASEAVREAKDLSWKKWSRRLNAYLDAMHAYFWPDLIILGGGASKKQEKFLPHLKVATEIVPARLRNEAGIIGAACLAAEAPSL